MHYFSWIPSRNESVVDVTYGDILVRDTSTSINIYTTENMWSNASQTTLGSDSSDRITVRLSGNLDLYLALSTCDLVTQEII